MLSMASNGRPRQSPPNRLAKRSSLGLGKHIGEGSLQRKSSGPLTVGEMIPFQRASRREPHVPSQNQESDGNVPRRTVQARSSVDEGQKVADRQQTSDANSNRAGNDSGGNKGSTVTSSVNRHIPHQPQKANSPDNKQMHARSVRPKVKRPSAPQQVSRSTSVASVSNRKADGEEVVVSSTTSPRRRIVKRNSQTTFSSITRGGNTATRESNNTDGNNQEQTVGQENSPNDILLTSFNSDIELPRTEPNTSSSNQGSIQETSLTSTASTGRHSAHSSRVLLRSRLSHDPPESQSTDQMNSQNNIRNDPGEDLTNNQSRSNYQNSAELRSRPPLTAREALARSLSRSGERMGIGRPTIQPAIASATELNASDNSLFSPERETYPNSVRRSYELSRIDNRFGSSLERPRLNRPTIASVTSRPRQRELIDVDSAVSALSRRVPSASTPFTSEGNDSNENSSPRLDQSTRLNEDDVWVPQRRIPSSQNFGNSPRTQGPTVSPLEGRMNTPDVVFRDSPVVETSLRRNSRLGSTESENSSSVTSASRPAPTLPNRRGLYRALSITEDEDINSEVGTSRSVPGTQRRTSIISRYENIDSDDMDMWRSIEGNPTHARQRLIQQDRARGRDSILSRTASGRRVVPPSEDSLPDINDNQEFPPLDSSREAGASSRPLRLSRETSQEQVSTGSGANQELGTRTRRTETPPPTPTPDRSLTGERYVKFVAYSMYLHSRQLMTTSL